MQREQYEPAEYDLTQALRLQPDQKDWLLARAQVRINMKHNDDAREDLERLVALGTPRAALQSFYQQLSKKKKRRR
jgi:regulator of sirC expression with transglutaminase-like and TPR domain